VQGKIVPYGTAFVPVVEAPVEEVEETPQEAAETGKATSMLDVIIEKLRGHGTPAHQVWLPPLAEPPGLNELVGELTVDERRGLVGAGWPGVGRLLAPVGIVDRPFEQRRDPFPLELDGAGGNVVIVGGPQSGKSTALRSMICSLALTHTPAEVQFFCLDFGGGTLRSLVDMPHVSGVAGRRDVEAVRRTVAEVSVLVDERETRFTELGVDSMPAYRRRRATGEISDDPFGDVFLVVDGWGTLRAEYEDLEGTITTLGSRALGFGVHVIITAARWAEIRINLRDMLGTKLELRLGDPGESELDRKAAANVPEKTPGRGLTKEKLHFLAAVPRIDGKNSVDDLSEGTMHLVEQVKAGWPYRPAPKVRLLPRKLPVAELAEIAGTEAPGIPIGLNEARLAPVRLDFASDPHFYGFGDAECGKTNLLRLIAQTITARYTPKEAMMVIADYRRGLLGAVDEKYLLGYAPSGQVFTEMVGAMKGALTQRIPGPDVTADQLRKPQLVVGPGHLRHRRRLRPGGRRRHQSAGEPGRAAAAGARHRPAPDRHAPGRWRVPRALRPSDPTPAGAGQSGLPDVGQQGGGRTAGQHQAEPTAARPGHADAPQRRHPTRADGVDRTDVGGDRPQSLSRDVQTLDGPA
jgi:S-DNA-T family DNA segregation ATPase FtsK/SpoIIIE